MALALDENFACLFPDSRPIFVVGAARSGTTIVGEALRFGAGIPGTREGFLYSTAYLLMTEIDALWQRIGPGLEYFAAEDRGDPARRRAIAHFDIHEYQRHCLRHFHDLSCQGERMWLDKTPDIYMVHATLILGAAYPRGRWIWVQRNGIDVLDSRRRTHPEMTFEQACRDWAMVVRDWYHVAPLLGDRWITVDQQEIATTPAETAARLATFLELDEPQRDGITEAFRSRQPGRTTERPLDDELRLTDAPWPRPEKQTFRAVCGEAMQIAGYPL